MRDQLDARHGAAQFGQTARHVVARGNNNQRSVASLAGPGLRLVGIANRVLRPTADVDATIELCGVIRCQPFERAARGMGIDAGNQHPLSPMIGQQPKRLVNARLATGQRHDAIGDRGGVRGLRGYAGKHQKARAQRKAHGANQSQCPSQHGQHPSA